MDLFNVPVTCPINRFFFPASNKWNKTLTVSCSDSFLRCHENEEHYCIMSLPLKILLYSFNQWTLFILQGSLCWHTFPLSLLFWFVLLFLFLLLFFVVVVVVVVVIFTCNRSQFHDPLFCFVAQERLFVYSSAAFVYLTFSACNLSRTVVVILLANRLIAFWWRNQAFK